MAVVNETLSNATMRTHPFVRGMFEDDYFPTDLVERVKAILVRLCERIESERPSSDEALLALTDEAVDAINDLGEAFEEADSELETGARESIGGDFLVLLPAYGFGHVDVEEAIRNRDW